MTELTIRGIPHSIANDGWWLSCNSASDPIEKHAGNETRARKVQWSPFAFLSVLALMLLADFLFWGQSYGVSLVVFSAALSGAAIASLRPHFTAAKCYGVAGAWIACAMPVVEFTQFTSVFILFAGHLGLLVWCAMQSRTFGPVLRNLIRLPYLMPAFSLFSGGAAIRNASIAPEFRPSRANVMVWFLPSLASCVFLLLFVGANPVFEQWLDQVTRIDFNVADPLRLGFWAVTAFAVYPFVAFTKLADTFKSEHKPRPSAISRFDGLFNARSVTISLFLFNAIFLIQNLTDIAFLWGRAALPEGLTYAQYAHQGAYPLMATSILAGMFVLVSRQFIASAPFLKLMLLVWILQNIFLVSSAFTRLDLYVDVYGLTYLRVRAGIGMGLVMAGMALLAWQLCFSKSNTLVSFIFSGVCAATIYFSSFVNFGHVIAHENLKRGADQIDVSYLCLNTSLAVSALVEHAEKTGEVYCEYETRQWVIGPDGWRDWGLRGTRLAASQHKFLKLLQTDGVTSTQPRFSSGYEGSSR